MTNVFHYAINIINDNKISDNNAFDMNVCNTVCNNNTNTMSVNNAHVHKIK